MLAGRASGPRSRGKPGTRTGNKKQGHQSSREPTVIDLAAEFRTTGAIRNSAGEGIANAWAPTCGRERLTGLCSDMPRIVRQPHRCFGGFLIRHSPDGLRTGPEPVHRRPRQAATAPVRLIVTSSDAVLKVREAARALVAHPYPTSLSPSVSPYCCSSTLRSRWREGSVSLGSASTIASASRFASCSRSMSLMMSATRRAGMPC